MQSGCSSREIWRPRIGNRKRCPRRQHPPAFVSIRVPKTKPGNHPRRDGFPAVVIESDENLMEWLEGDGAEITPPLVSSHRQSLRIDRPSLSQLDSEKGTLSLPEKRCHTHSGIHTLSGH